MGMAGVLATGDSEVILRADRGICVLDAGRGRRPRREQTRHG
jgi:hypothetical protein